MTKFEEVFNQSFEEILVSRLEAQYLVVNVVDDEVFVNLPDVDFGTSIKLPKEVNEEYLERQCNGNLNYIILGITNAELKEKYEMHFRRLCAHIYTVFDILYYEYKLFKKIESEKIKED